MPHGRAGTPGHTQRLNPLTLAHESHAALVQIRSLIKDPPGGNALGLGDQSLRPEKEFFSSFEVTRDLILAMALGKNRAG